MQAENKPIYRILKYVEYIEINLRMKVEEQTEAQAQLISIDKQLRQERKFNSKLAEKCTELLRGINYAVSIYLPKQKRLGVSLIKEAVDYLKYELVCLELQVEQVKEYVEERKEYFNLINDIEVQLFRIEKYNFREGKTVTEKLLISRDSIFDSLRTLTQEAIDKQRGIERHTYNTIGLNEFLTPAEA